MNQHKIAQLEKVVEDLTKRIPALEEHNKTLAENNQRATRSKTVVAPPEDKSKLEELQIRMDNFHDRLMDVEDIVHQLNEDSTQPSIAPPKEIKELEQKISDVEK